MKRRIGKLYISDELIKDMDISEMLKVTSKFVVIRCEFLYHSNQFEYIAICPDFDEIGNSVMPPTYDVELKTEFNEELQKSEIVDVKFIRSVHDAN